MSGENGRLAGRVAVVTGSSRGIGRAIALAFAQEGATVCVTYANRRDKAEEVAAAILAMGRDCLVSPLDVQERSSIRAAFAATVERFGKLDVLVNNAGINRRGFFEETTEQDWDMVLSVNLKGPFLCCQEAFPHMKRAGSGRIINISSVAGQYHGPKTVHYAVSKAGLNSLTKVVARYGAPHDILVNAVAPGIMLTDQTQAELASEAGRKIIDMTLLKKAGRLEDVTPVCVLLASAEQDYITGQVISVSGGAYLG